MAQIRDPRTDPRPGDTFRDPYIHAQVAEVDADDGTVYFTTGEEISRRTWDDLVATGAEVTAGPDDEGGPFVDPGPDTAPDDPLADVERKARVLCTLLDVVGKAEFFPKDHYARVAVECWLRPVFAGLGPDAPATAPERDPRLDPKPGDTKTWTAQGTDATYTYTVTVAHVTAWGDVDVGERVLRAEGWADDCGGTAVWTSGGVS